jgi:hypothetical protein
MARKRVLNVALGQRLLQSKLDVLAGIGGRRPSLALTILTGSVPEPRPAEEIEYAAAEPRHLPEPLPFPLAARAEVELAAPESTRARQYVPRTVYLSDRHLRDLDAIVEALQPTASRHLTRSAVLRQAIEHLRAGVLTTHPAEGGAEPTLEHDEHA